MQNFRLEIELTKHVFFLSAFIDACKSNTTKVRKLYYKLVLKYGGAVINCAKKA